MNRTAIIDRRLSTHFHEDLGISVFTVSAQAWLKLPVPPRYRFGWFPPIPVNDEAMVMTFAPELINRVTEDLDDFMFDLYLTVIELVVDAYVDRRGQSPEEIDRYVEDALFVNAAIGLRIWHEVDARAIDAGIVPALT